MPTALSVFLHRVTGLLLLTGIFASTLPLAAAPYERIQTLSMDDGLPHSDVNAIVQDPDGYLWFATFSGLCKYDGYRIQTFRTDNSNLSSDRVLTLFIARDSSLYIGTESGGLNCYNPATESITPINDESHASADQVVNDIFQDHDGTIWVCRNDGLACLDTRNGGSSLRSKPRWGGYYIQCGTVLEDGRLLLSTDAGPAIYNPETEEIQNVLRDEIRARCLSIRTLRDGKIALSGGWGVRILDPESWKVSRICDFSSRIVFQDSQGELWVGAFNQGLYKYDANGAQLAHYHPKLPIPHAISSFEISALFEDRSGVLWIGTIGGGLNRLNIVEKHIACFTEAQGLSENRVITFLEARDGTLWVSTHGGNRPLRPTVGVVPQTPHQRNAEHPIRHRLGLLHRAERRPLDRNLGQGPLDRPPQRGRTGPDKRRSPGPATPSSRHRRRPSPSSESSRTATAISGSAPTAAVSSTFRRPPAASTAGSTMLTTSTTPIRSARTSRPTSVPIPPRARRPSGSEPARD